VTELTLPVYKADKANSKISDANYLTDVNKERNDIEAAKIGTVKLTVRFKMGMDNTHYQWVKTNDEHETYESWQCSVAEGYRTRIVSVRPQSLFKISSIKGGSTERAQS